MQRLGHSHLESKSSKAIIRRRLDELLPSVGVKHCTAQKSTSFYRAISSSKTSGIISLAGDSDPCRLAAF